MICKSSYSNGVYNSNVGFILTMWYVNDKVYFTYEEAKKGFILTMWYVNVQR